MGLLKPAVASSHSFGMFGLGLSTTSYDAAAQSMLSKKTDMDNNNVAHYMTVSLWAVNTATDAQTVSADYGSFAI